MACEYVRIGEHVAIVCGRARRRRCTACGHTTSNGRECDWKLAGGKTCDAFVCAACATNVGPDKDLCKAHAEKWARHPKNPARAGASQQQQEEPCQTPRA